MLMHLVEQYLSLRRALGFQLRDAARHLRAYATFAASRQENHVRQQTVIQWATEGRSGNSRRVRFRDMACFARFAHAEDKRHEVPTGTPFPYRTVRRLPYIYSPEEITRIVEEAARLEPCFPLRPKVYSTLFGLIAATGLRITEALDLRVADVHDDGVLHVRRTKFGKSRMVPLHATAVAALERYMDARLRVATTHDSVFLSRDGRPLGARMAQYTFRRILLSAEIPASGGTRPRIHDLRHSFATRALEQCALGQRPVARHFVALATYMGHSDIANTYWYLEATPVLMTSVAAAAEALLTKGQS